MSEKQPDYGVTGGNIRSVMTILPELRAGRTVTDLSAAIHDAVAAVREHGKKATVTLRLTIAPVTQQNLVEPAIIVVPEVESKLPTETPDSTLFFIDADGNVTRHVERKQPDLGFGVVPQSNSAA